MRYFDAVQNVLIGRFGDGSSVSFKSVEMKVTAKTQHQCGIWIDPSAEKILPTGSTSVLWDDDFVFGCAFFFFWSCNRRDRQKPI